MAGRPGRGRRACGSRDAGALGGAESRSLPCAARTLSLAAPNVLGDFVLVVVVMPQPISYPHQHQAAAMRHDCGRRLTTSPQGTLVDKGVASVFGGDCRQGQDCEHCEQELFAWHRGRRLGEGGGRD
jgi:hypothetical protein